MSRYKCTDCGTVVERSLIARTGLDRCEECGRITAFTRLDPPPAWSGIAWRPG